MTFKTFLREQWYNETLHPRFWNSENEFDPNVRDKLLDIAKDFAEGDDLWSFVEDVQLTGSLANYNYTGFSDLDVHILFDFSKLNNDIDLVKSNLDGKRYKWNNNHEIKIRDHEVELYYQDIHEYHTSSGLYSLYEDRWITEPKYDQPEVDTEYVKRKAKSLQREIHQLHLDLLRVRKDPQESKKLHLRANRFREKLFKMRKDSLLKDGEFGVGNLVFKFLRNVEDIKKLMDITNKAYDNIYSESKYNFIKYNQETYLEI